MVTGQRARERHGRGARLLTAAGGAVAVQFVVAGGSFVLQVLAARTLGAAGYGSYALLYAVLVLLIAIQTSWVGDSLTVFDRFEPRIRGAILISVYATIALGALAAVVIAVVVGISGAAAPALFSLLVALWLLNETGRRIFTARMEFWRLVANDSCYYAVTFVILAVALASGVDASLELFLGSMCVGLAVATGLARLRLPRQEFARVPLRGAALREVFEFAGWRSIQAGLRPLSMFLARLLIAALAGPAVLGSIEAARLLVAPGVTIVNGSGWFLLGDFAKAQQSGRPSRARDAVRATVLLAGITLALGLAAVLFVDVLEPLLTAGSFPIDRVALVGWVLHTVCYACALPLSSLATARRRSRLVFVIRGVESAVVLALVAAVLLADPSRASLVPYLLAGGGLASWGLLWYCMRHDDPVTVEQPAESGVSRAAEEQPEIAPAL